MSVSPIRKALFSSAVVGSVAHAGAVVMLVPNHPGPYASGETLVVAVRLMQDPGGGDIFLRGIRLDFNASDPDIVMKSFEWDFSGSVFCGSFGICDGTGYEQFPQLDDSDGAIVNNIFSSGSPNLNSQIKLPATGMVTVGHIVINLPSVPGQYLLDAMNRAASSANPNNAGAALYFDFTNPQTWRPGSGLSEGMILIEVGGPISPDCNHNQIPDEDEDCNSDGIPDECETVCSGDFCGCQSPFDGPFAGPSQGIVMGTLNCGGVLELAFETSTGFTLFQTEAGVTGEGTIVGTGQKIVVGGVFDFQTCSATGTWKLAGGATGDWDIQLSRSCLPDCNENFIPDECDIRDARSLDCNDNSVPDECDLASGKSFDCNANDIPDECEEPPVFRITLSDPPDGLIDARQDRSITGQTPQGIDRVRLSFSCQPIDSESGEAISAESFDITATFGLPPVALSLTEVNGEDYTYDLLLSDPIPSGAWTTLTVHVVSPDGVRLEPSFNRITLGFLPADVNGDKTSSPVDILEWIDDLNRTRVPVLDEWHCDIDRSGLCAPADILREIDLLDGSRTSRPWNGVSLPPRP